ncbi:hypothetical protein ACRAWD_21290 [Caulobacter segnis]
MNRLPQPVRAYIAGVIALTTSPSARKPSAEPAHDPNAAGMPRDFWARIGLQAAGTRRVRSMASLAGQRRCATKIYIEGPAR